METIVVGYIPSPQGVSALEAAVDRAKRTGGRITVVNTGRNGNYADPPFAPEPHMDAIDQQLTKAGIPHEVLQPIDGRSAADQILTVAQETKADLVIIGIRGRSPVGKLITGSTAQQILLGAHCAVLAVKASSG